VKDNIEDKVLKIISKNLNVNKSSIKLRSKIEDLSADSIALFGLIVAFEKEFKHEVAYEDLIRIITVKDIIKYINNVTANKK